VRRGETGQRAPKTPPHRRRRAARRWSRWRFNQRPRVAAAVRDRRV